MLKRLILLHTNLPGFTTSKAQLQLIRTLTHQHHYQESQHFLETKQIIHFIHSTSSTPFATLLGLCKNKSFLQKVHSFLIIHGLIYDPLYQTRLVSLYGSLGHVINARLVFDQLPQPDLSTYKEMIRWYLISDLYRDIIRLYICMRRCLRENDKVIFSIVLKACSKLRNVKEGRKVHCHIVKAVNPDSFVLRGLVNFYAKCGEVESSRDVFDEIVDRNVVCWTSMIAGYVQNDCAEKALVLFNRMRNELIQGNQYTFGSICTACTKLGALHQGKWVHGYVIKNGIDDNTHLVTALLDMYSKCGFISDARIIFDESCIIDLILWTAMIVGYTQHGYPNHALQLFTDKKWLDLVPNSVTIASVISACGQVGNLKFGKLVHGIGVTLRLEDVNVKNALVHMYAKCNMIGDACYLFKTSKKDVITWNSIISGHAQTGSAYEAMRFFNQMRSQCFQPDAVTLVTVLSACASVGALQVGYSLHAHAIKEGLLSYRNVYIGTTLLSLYAKCGNAESARIVFDEMEEKNKITWNAMIDGYGMQGNALKSLALFDDMLKGKMEPSDATFTALLSACSHSGMVGEAKKHFDSMCKTCNLVPSMKHYVCMVDLLSRAGRLEEARDFIEKMPIRPDVSIYGAFLHGCSLHSRYDLGESAVRGLQELNPDDASYYVLMSKLYASDGRWNQSYRVRELMKARDLNKSPGWSSVKMEDIDSELPL